MVSKGCIMVDVEGTLSNCDHRIHHLENKNYDKWNELFINDTPNIKNIKMVENWYKDNKTIIISTAKPYKYLREVKQWIKQNCSFVPSRFLFRYITCLTSPEVKQEHIHMLRNIGFKINSAIDDRDDILEMYRKNNILAIDAKI